MSCDVPDDSPREGDLARRQLAVGPDSMPRVMVSRRNSMCLGIGSAEQSWTMPR